MKRRTTATPPRAGTFQARLFALPPPWRLAAAALEAVARASLPMIVLALLFAENPPTNPLVLMRMFAGLFLAPKLAAWCIARAFAADLRVEDGMVVLEHRDRRTEIAAQAVAAVECWQLPLPRVGVWLRLRSGRRFSQGIAVVDPESFVKALVAQGADPRLTDALRGRSVVYANARLAAPDGRLENPLVKFVVFSLVPALPAFRLHQYITYGGTFGEYQTFGLEAYLLALGIWWVSWAIGLVLYASVLRVAVEAGTVASVLVRPAWASTTRRGLHAAARALFYVGVPAWLLIRLWPW